MKFTPRVVHDQPSRRLANVGDVYPAKGGRGDSRYWIVLAVNDKGYASCLGIGEEGQITSAQTYGVWAFEERPLVGRCEGIESMNFEIEWMVSP